MRLNNYNGLKNPTRIMLEPSIREKQGKPPIWHGERIPMRTWAAMKTYLRSFNFFVIV
jgi:hypothetical protein